MNELTREQRHELAALQLHVARSVDIAQRLNETIGSDVLREAYRFLNEAWESLESLLSEEE